MNYLKAVFWDYPQCAQEESLRDYLKQRQNEIEENLPEQKLSDYTIIKWKRMIEIYGKH